jgi:hypothetical protein
MISKLIFLQHDTARRPRMLPHHFIFNFCTIKLETSYLRALKIYRYFPFMKSDTGDGVFNIFSKNFIYSFPYFLFIFL